ncbi:type IX secretion system membrane protein PorP/SprF, partial [Arthrospira platensis SPKY1]|nr:type IX secretion system membrane protein PorP/SprF [Arthrospira platensis SPKY1]
MGAGLQLLTDEAGDGRMRWVQGAVSLAYRLPLSDYFALSAGVQGSFAQRAFQWSGLTFDEQFDGDQFNPALASGEDLSANTLSLFSMAAGGMLQFAVPQTRT